MQKSHILTGSETLVIASPRTIAGELLSANALATEAEQSGCMIVVENDVSPENNHIADAIESLLNSGCSMFVCLGSKAEKLHDLIDDRAERRDLTSEHGSAACDVITTWHDAEPLEDVVELFFNLCNDRGVTKQIVLVDDEFNGRQQLCTLLLKKEKASNLRKENTS